MDYGLAREIYGVNPWCMDPISLHSMSSILRNLQNGIELSIPETKYNQFYLLDLKSNTTIVSEKWQLNNENITEAVGLIKLDGPITKNGGASSYGTKQLSNLMLSMSKDERVKGFIIDTDSGGGSSAAVDLMVSAINEVKKTKPVYTLIGKGGMMASAAYGIGSAGNKIFAEDPMSIVGSVGTMISFEGKPANTTSPDGTKNIVLYATKSTEKNKAFEEALNNDNYSLLINDLLDPINESFINTVLLNRPQLKGTKFDNGHTVFAKDAIGTFIDGMATFDEVVQMVLQDSKNYTKTSSSSNNNKSKISSKMTREQLLQEHPELFNSIVSEGVTKERERVKSLLNYQKADNEFVINAIKSGESITESKREELLIKMHSFSAINNLESDSSATVQTEETPTATNENPKGDLEQATEFYKNLMK